MMIPAMRLTILYFAHLPERTGTREEVCELPDGAGVPALVALLEAAHPALKGALSACRVAINEEFARADAPLADGCTVAFIPPVSGG